MTYVALLRGINVGGNTKVDMKRLKHTFESLGCSEVQTYINSGNVIFADERSATELVDAIEYAIERNFGIAVSVVVRDYDQIALINDKVPEIWTNDTDQKTDVMFLWPNIDSPTILQKITVNPEVENVLYVAGALIWNIARKDATRGNGVKLIKTDLYKSMTVRNINTVRKLRALMQGSQQS